MKNTFKRIFALLLALVMVLSLAACGGAEEKPAADANQPAAAGKEETGKEEAGKITILYPGEETPRFKEFLENEFAAKVKEDIGLEIEMIWLPWDQYWTQKEIMLSAGDEIDLYWDGLADLSTFVNKHQARPLDDLIQTYGQDTAARLGEEHSVPGRPQLPGHPGKAQLRQSLARPFLHQPLRGEG